MRKSLANWRYKMVFEGGQGLWLCSARSCDVRAFGLPKADYWISIKAHHESNEMLEPPGVSRGRFLPFKISSIHVPFFGSTFACLRLSFSHCFIVTQWRKHKSLNFFLVILRWRMRNNWIVLVLSFASSSFSPFFFWLPRVHVETFFLFTHLWKLCLTEIETLAAYTHIEHNTLNTDLHENYQVAWCLSWLLRATFGTSRWLAKFSWCRISLKNWI